MKIAALYFFAIALLGLFAGGCITILFIIIPFWLRLPPENLMQWFTDYGARVGITMLPMEIAPLLLCLAAYFKVKKIHPESKRMWLIVNISNALVLAGFFIYFLPVNISFVTHSISSNEVNAELKRWELMHIARTILSVLSTAVAIAIATRYARQHIKKIIDN